MKKILLVFLTLACVVMAHAQQTDPMKTSGTRTLENGTTVTTTDQALLNMSMTNEVDFSMRSDSRDGITSIYFVMGIPYKEINIASDATLDLTLGDGSIMRLPVEKAMTWSQDKITVTNGSKSADVMRIPYRVTDEQISTITTKGVKNVQMAGTNRTVSFSSKGNTFKNILTRQYKQLTSTGDSQKGAQIPTQSASMGLKVTPETKYFSVNSFESTELLECNESNYIVYNTKSHEAVIFDSVGSLTGRFKHGRSDLKLNTRFENGRAIVNNGNGWVIIDTHGNIIKELEKYGIYTPLLDGIAIYSDRSLAQAMANKPADFVYVDQDGKRIYPDKAYRSEKALIMQLSENLRGYPKNMWTWGFMDKFGKTAIEPKYWQISDFSDGLAAVSIMNDNEELWGFIDKDGNFVIEPKFSNQPDDFLYGYSIARKKNKNYVFINKKGETVSDEYTIARRLPNGNTLVRKVGDYVYTILDKNLEFVASIPSVTEIKGYVLLCKDTVYSLDGKKLFSNVDSIDEMPKNGITWCRAQYNGNYTIGLINDKGEWILILNQSEF